VIKDDLGDLLHLRSFAVVKCGSADQPVDLLDRQRQDLCGCPCPGKERQGSNEGGFISGSDRDHAGEKLLEGRLVASLVEFEEDRLWVRRNRLSKASYHIINVIWFLIQVNPPSLA